MRRSNNMFKNINTTAKNNQALWDNLGILLYKTQEQIGGRYRIGQTFTNMKYTLAVNQGQDVYIFH